MTFQEFAPIYLALSRSLQHTKADPEEITAYFHVLETFETPHVGRAALALARDGGRRFFPTTSEWAEKAAAAAADTRSHELAEPRTWKTECERCDDTGWAREECPGTEICGRRHGHQPHAVVRACPCRLTNRTYRRHHA